MQFPGHFSGPHIIISLLHNLIYYIPRSVKELLLLCRYSAIAGSDDGLHDVVSCHKNLSREGIF